MVRLISFAKPFQCLLLFLTVVSFCPRSATVEAFQFVPILSLSALKDPLASKHNSKMLCAAMGGVLASEPTEPTHVGVIAAAQEAGGGSEWYAYLGADTRDPKRTDCPEPYKGARSACYWRWNQGRWLELPDNASLKYYTPHIGVTFYIGNHYNITGSDVGRARGYFSYFENAEYSTNQASFRPGCLFGRDLLAIGNENSSIWSDNLEEGGYKYAGYTHADHFTFCAWNDEEIGLTKDKFLAVCEIQVPSRYTIELPDDIPSVSEKWWLVYLMLLICICTIIFFIVLCCQDREDLTKSKSCVNQVGFELFDPDNVPYTDASGHWNHSQTAVEQFSYHPQPSFYDASFNQRSQLANISRIHNLDRYGSQRY